MLKQVMLFLAVAAASVVSAVEPVWKNPEVNQQNREPRRANYFAYESRALAEKGDKAASSRYLSMEGMWKFNFVKNYPDRPKDFFKTDYDDSSWTDFPVPGLFEINGYGDRIYKNTGYAWATTFFRILLFETAQKTHTSYMQPPVRHRYSRAISGRC